MSIEKLKSLQIEPQLKRRCGGSFRLISLGIVGVLGIAAVLARPWEHESQRVMRAGSVAAAASDEMADTRAATNTPAAVFNSSGGTDSAALTVSGYIINAARIQISPRFLGVVEWIGVKKGDPVHEGEVLARLDDREYKAKLVQAEGVLASAKVAVEKAELAYKRAHALTASHVATQESEDDARLEVENARASLQQAEGSHDEARAYVDWCTIRSPIDGVVVEKLVNPDELVMPQSFGGLGGPSTALLAVASPQNLQVEIDVNESDLSKIAINQKCLVSPGAYPDRVYKGHVAEIAPEANRAKGTLQVKVQIEAPDRYLTPELSAKVEFLRVAGVSQAGLRGLPIDSWVTRAVRELRVGSPGSSWASCTVSATWTLSPTYSIRGQNSSDPAIGIPVPSQRTGGPEPQHNIPTSSPVRCSGIVTHPLSFQLLPQFVSPTRSYLRRRGRHLA